MVVSNLSPDDGITYPHHTARIHPRACSADEAGQYLKVYKQSEHRLSALIRERDDKTPDALLRTALTSIPRVNKPDVETLRESFDVRPNCPLSPSPFL